MKTHTMGTNSSRMTKPPVLVIGNSNTDLIVKAGRIPKPGETILGGEFARAAAAISVTRFGAQPSAPRRREIEAVLATGKVLSASKVRRPK
jgi:sugar/nucleoside kinase (ribokinase family)